MPEPEDMAALAGMSDATLAARTGRTWRQWVAALDAADAAGLSHAQIADHVARTYGVSGWWAQTVTVGYERIRGLRAVGQRRGSDHFDANKSRTFPVPVARLYAAMADPAWRARWLPDIALTVRTAIPDRSLRITWPDGTSVQAWFTAKGPEKSQLAIQHGKLTDRDDVAARKAWWTERLQALAELL